MRNPVLALASVLMTMIVLVVMLWLATSPTPAEPYYDKENLRVIYLKDPNADPRHNAIRCVVNTLTNHISCDWGLVK